MSWQATLNDPSIQEFLKLLGLGLLAIVSGWASDQLPALKQASQRWPRVLKLVVEAAIATFMFSRWSAATGAIGTTDEAAQVASMAYGVVWLGLVIVMVADVIQLVRGNPTQQLDPEVERLQTIRQALMDKVRVKWIDGVLHKSLYQRARIELGLEERPELVGMQWQPIGQNRQVLPRGTRLWDRFVTLGKGGTLLILGEPGAGKTTLLLELAQDLLRMTHAQ